MSSVCAVLFATMLFQFYIPIFQRGKGFLNILNHVFLLPYTKKPPFYNHVFQDNQYFTLFFSAITILLQTISQLLSKPIPSALLPQIHIQVQATPALSKKWMELQHILKLYLLILLHHTGLAYFLVTLMDQSFAVLKGTVLNHFPT